MIRVYFVIFVCIKNGSAVPVTPYSELADQSLTVSTLANIEYHGTFEI